MQPKAFSFSKPARRLSYSIKLHEQGYRRQALSMVVPASRGTILIPNDPMKAALATRRTHSVLSINKSKYQLGKASYST
eukprot:CAMPEP_0113953776 /NCGR_PEP_ID=MMETSP0011_2-20120614/34_1 /TAXON_ID=101924 /ORGANISM="Rhodosorus marinus" /LENGTH=78 /DNA_ID=CAMNT_0000962529 /DNA_START=536 /DNA_END=772 /DNA_ORIENTATION=- /assembly_acc=CAM_ASM_000156